MGNPIWGFLGSRTSKKVGGHIRTVLGMKLDDSGWPLGLPAADEHGHKK
jgi:hypothetical protein